MEKTINGGGGERRASCFFANAYNKMKNKNQPFEDSASIGNFTFDNLGRGKNEIIPAVQQLSEKTAEDIFDRTKQLMETVVQYKELMMRYSCAMKEIRTKFDVLNTEFNSRYQRNPIDFISTRLKNQTSIVEKLTRRGCPVSMKSIEENINDVAGVRVICSYIDDIYKIADALTRQDDITLIEVKDYIKNPKPNGYRSLHLIVSVPVFFSTQKKDMKVEVQIRTIAMDFWASLEHQLKYKKNVSNEKEIIASLRECADTIAQTDITMQDIRRKIEDSTEAPDEDEILIEQLRRLNISIE